MIEEKATEYWDDFYSRFGANHPRGRIFLTDKISDGEKERVLSNLRRGNPSLNSALYYFGDLRDRRLVDIGCGIGRASLFFALHGASVVSIDISKEGIQRLKHLCHVLDIPNLMPVSESALHVDKLGPFDFAYGDMILHHIEPFDRFCAALRRALSPNARGFFRENSAASSLLIWFRRNVVGKLWIPKYRDPWEFPLTLDEIATLRESFRVERDFPEMVFFQLISKYLLRGRLNAPFKVLDAAAHKLPALRKRSYHQLLLLS